MPRKPANKTSPALEDYAQASTASTTKRAYAADLKRFLDWGGKIPCKPDKIAAYLSEHAPTHTAATLARWMASISVAHQAQGLESPTRSPLVRQVMRGIRNTHGAKPRRVSPAVAEELLAMVEHTKKDLTGLRNRAILLVGFAGALRRSEIAALTVASIQFDARGMILRLGKTKTDQAGERDEVAIPFAKGKHCPVKMLKRWLAESGITKGPVFRSISQWGKLGTRKLAGYSIAEIVKGCARAAGLDATLYSGHSLRAGLATDAARRGKPYHKIKAQTRHRSDTTLLKYIRDAEIFEDNAADML